MVIEELKIRKLYYFSTVSIVLILLVIINVINLTTFHNETTTRIEQLKENTIDMKKLYISGIIENTILHIEIEKKIILEELASSAEKFNDKLKLILSNETYNDEFVSKIKNLQVDYSYLFLQLSKDDSVFNFGDESENLELLLNDEVNNFKYTIQISKDYIDDVTKAHTIQYIKEIRLQDNGYIWINQILNYSGGDDYAVRLVHPNMPETEGLLLSTNTEDEQGNKPYLIELQGILLEGELYNEYFFKKMDSNITAHKLSYAKLYEPYDWVIATGVYLDDIDILIQNEILGFKIEFKKVFISSLVVSFISLIFSSAVIFLFERQIHQMISTYTLAIKEQNLQLENEKNTMEALALYDELTGLLNRRSMETRIDAMIKTYQAKENSFALVLCDIDHFKNVNDTYGHDAGDKVLASVAKCIESVVRANDYVSRWGGEEFVILLSNASKDIAYMVAEKIRLAVESEIVFYDKKEIKCTISLGVAIYKKDSLGKKGLLKEADKLMYIAKQNGRNLTVIS
ncbi:MAG: sensor domain-containing diguanylate cyclase [Clostridia bacterium]|nr:sensor domain-containing diguanylate cyclase [Clostridia bacterium]